ncbi:hypothetical protein BDV95DRAFT_571488 [Massariosphaeria phaeospora]|uniref:F-box domain-containing protein n=1 Tax=Massariosphaeria phaeospora TaxID=100035 RepID=A0A7C8IEG1_9PLEO|nr:hypothetical protein BDV95DRAFT_571488 [Massariosphaeria phaeospora]
MTASPPPLPFEVWLLIFAQGDHDDDHVSFLWSTCRNVSHFWRAVVDDIFRAGIVPHTLLTLNYGGLLRYDDMHTNRRSGRLYIPMVFDRFTEDGAKAVFQQRVLKKAKLNGLMRCWLPVVERCYDELESPKPEVLNRSPAHIATRLGEQEQPHFVTEREKDRYLKTIQRLTRIGQGDCPPWSIKIGRYFNDSMLVEPVVDCKQRELSFNWKKTFALFFREIDFVYRAHRSLGEDRYVERINPAFYHSECARRKRLRVWTAKNRVPPEIEPRKSYQDRWSTLVIAYSFIAAPERLRSYSYSESDAAEEEILLEKLAAEHLDLVTPNAE